MRDPAAAWPKVRDQITASELAKHEHRLVFDAIAKCGENADATVVGDVLAKRNELQVVGGMAFLADLVQDASSAANVETYATIVKEAGRKRDLGAFAAALQRDSANGVDADELLARMRRRIEHDDATELHTVKWAPLDAAALLDTPAPPPSMVIADWLPAGYATLLAGHGGAGKSSIALRLAVCLAVGRPWYGLHCEQRRVLYLACEDRAAVLQWRLQRICDAEGLTPAERETLAAELKLMDLVGRDALLYRRFPNGADFAPAFAELSRLTRETGAQALFVDGVADTYGAPKGIAARSSAT